MTQTETQYGARMLPPQSKSLTGTASTAAAQSRLLIVGTVIALVSATLGYVAHPATQVAATGTSSLSSNGGGSTSTTGTGGSTGDLTGAGAAGGSGISTGTGTSGPSISGTSGGGNSGSVGSGTSGSGTGAGGTSSTGGGCPFLTCGPLKNTDQGVTATTIKIGVLIANTSQVSAAGVNAGLAGNQEKPVKAWVNELSRLKIQGRKVVVVSQSFDVTSVSDMQAACKAMTQDQKVFAVLSTGGYDSVAQLCITKENHTPFIGTDPEPADWYQQAAPYLWSTWMNKDRIMLNNAKWLPHSGWLRPGDKVGLIYHDIPNVAPSVEKTYIPALKAQGITPEVIKLASDSQQGLAQITPAVNQFARDHVTFVIPVMNLIYKSKFQQDANSQAYHPRYDESDIYFGCSEFTTTSYDKGGQFNGTECLTSTDNPSYNAQTNAKHPSPWVKYITQVYERTYPKGYADGGDTASTQFVLAASWGSLFMLFYHAAERAGTQLTRPVWGQAMQMTGNVTQQIGYCSMSFGKGKFDGTDYLSVSQFHHEASDGLPADSFHTIKPCFKNYY
jgi:hypothetical protein